MHNYPSDISREAFKIIREDLVDVPLFGNIFHEATRTLDKNNYFW
jgi:hypothetical protein